MSTYLRILPYVLKSKFERECSERVQRKTNEDALRKCKEEIEAMYYDTYRV